MASRCTLMRSNAALIVLHEDPEEPGPRCCKLPRWEQDCLGRQMGLPCMEQFHMRRFGSPSDIGARDSLCPRASRHRRKVGTCEPVPKAARTSTALGSPPVDEVGRGRRRPESDGLCSSSVTHGAAGGSKSLSASMVLRSAR